MPFKVRVSAEVAKTKSGAGTRRRAEMIFSREWSYLDKVPKAVKDDDHLEVKKCSKAEMEAAGSGSDQMSLIGDKPAQGQTDAEQAKGATKKKTAKKAVKSERTQ